MTRKNKKRSNFQTCSISKPSSSFPWRVPLGRRDSTTASRAKANSEIPSPFSNLQDLINNFKNQGLNEKDLVILSGSDANLAPLDPTPANFDSAYFSNLVKQKGLIHSDQELFNGVSTDGLVRDYSLNFKAFAADFDVSMVKMGNIKPLIGTHGRYVFKISCVTFTIID